MSDEEFLSAKRAFESDPADESAARRYKEELLRAGRGDEVRRLFQVKFACPKKWKDLAPTSRFDVRFCGDCQKDVFFANDTATLAEHVRANRCVATDSRFVQDCTDALSKDESLSLSPGPCLVGASVPPVDRIFQQSARSLFRANRWVPLRREGSGLVVIAIAQREPVLDQATQPLRTVLVSQSELEKLSRTFPPEVIVMGKVSFG